MAFKGDLKSLTLSTVLQILSSEEKTGVLEIVRGPTKSTIYLKGGKIIAASSGHKQLQLGSILYSKKLISRDQLRKAVEEATKSGKKLGEMLLALGYVNQETLKKVVRHQVRETVLDLFLMEQGEFEYRDCQVQFDEQVFDEINAMEIMLEAARRMDEWAVIRKLIPSDTMVFELSELAKEQGGELFMDTEELQLSSLLDGKKSVREIVKESDKGDFSVYKMLYAMATSKMVQPVEKGSAAEEGVIVEDIETILPIYHDVLVIISRHLEDELGEGFFAKILSGCKLSMPEEHRLVVDSYNVHLSGAENVNKILALMNKISQGEAALSAVTNASNQMVSCLLLQETEILGKRQTQHTIHRIHELLGAVESYRGREAEYSFISGIRNTVSQVSAQLEG